MYSHLGNVIIFMIIDWMDIPPQMRHYVHELLKLNIYIYICVCACVRACVRVLINFHPIFGSLHIV